MTEIHMTAESDTQLSDSILMSDVLPIDNVEINIAVSSRKKLLQRLAQLASADNDETSIEVIFKVLTERERLGSTGIGSGVAVPHGRIEGLSSPTLAVVRLENAIEFDAPDGQPIWLAVCLLVPADANDTHLKLLARLATQFKQDAFIQQVRTLQTVSSLHSIFLQV